METPEQHPKPVSWIKNNSLFILVIILLIFFCVRNYLRQNDKLNSLESLIFESIALPTASLDFQNKSGVARIKASFTDILIASDGSRKRDDGYELTLRIINPSSIYLHNIKNTFIHIDSNKSAACNDVNMRIAPGASKTLKCFISDLSDSDLKSVVVSVDFEQMSYSY